MKYLGLILMMALVANQVLGWRFNPNDGPFGRFRLRRNLNDRFRQFLESLKISIRSGNETLGIPPLDPYYGDQINFLFNADKIKGTVELMNYGVKGISNYYVDQSEVSLLVPQIKIGLTWPEIYSAGSYQLDLFANNYMEIYGTGMYRFALNDLSFESNIKFSIWDGLQISGIESSINLGALRLDVTGLFDDEDLSKIASQALSDMAPQLVEDYQRELTDMVNVRIKETVNNLLEGKSLGDLIGMLG